MSGTRPPSHATARNNKFHTVNLNSVYSGKSLLPPNSKSGPGAKHGLQSLGKPTAVRRMPPPANLPSLRSESSIISSSSTPDLSVNLVPSGSQGWATSTETNGNAQPQIKPAAPAAATQSNYGDSKPNQAPHSNQTPRWHHGRSSDGGAAAFFSAQSQKDFPSLGSNNADKQSADAMSLKPQKCGSWKTGGGSKQPQLEEDVCRPSPQDSPAQTHPTQSQVAYNVAPSTGPVSRYGGMQQGYPAYPYGGGYHQPPPNYPPPPPHHYYGPPHNRQAANYDPPPHYPPNMYDHPHQHRYAPPPHMAPRGADYPPPGPPYGPPDNRGYPPPRGPYPPPTRIAEDGENPAYYDVHYQRYEEGKRVVWSDEEDKDDRKMVQRNGPPQEYGPPPQDWVEGGPGPGGDPAGEQYARGASQRGGYPAGPRCPPPEQTPVYQDWYAPPQTQMQSRHQQPPDYFDGPESPRAIPRDFEEEEKDEKRRHKAQLAEREAAIERSRQKRRLGQQGSAASSTQSSEITCELHPKSTEVVSDQDAASETERPPSNESYSKSNNRRTAANHHMPPRFSKLATQNETSEADNNNKKRKSDRPKPAKESENKWTRKPPAEPKQDYKLMKRPDSKESASGSERGSTRGRNKPNSNGAYSIEAPAPPMTLKQEYAKPLTLDEDEEDDIQEMTPLGKCSTKIVKRTAGGVYQASNKRQEKTSNDVSESNANQHKTNADGSCNALPEANVWEMRRQEREKESQEKEAQRFFDDRRRNEDDTARFEHDSQYKNDVRNETQTQTHRGRGRREFFASTTNTRGRRGAGSQSTLSRGQSSRGGRRGASAPMHSRRPQQYDNQEQLIERTTNGSSEHINTNGNEATDNGHMPEGRRGRGQRGRGRGAQARMDPSGLTQLSLMMRNMYPYSHLASIQPLPRRFSRGRGPRPATFNSGRGGRANRDRNKANEPPDKEGEGEHSLNDNNDVQDVKPPRAPKRQIPSKRITSTSTLSVRTNGTSSVERAAQAKSPTASEGYDEWETASESSDVGQNTSRKNAPPQRFSTQRRDHQRNKTNWGPGSGTNRKDDDKSKSQANVPKNSIPASHQKIKSSLPMLKVGRVGGLAGIDMNDASLVIIDNHPDLHVEDIHNDFTPVLSKKDKRLRYQQQQIKIVENQRKAVQAAAARKIKEEKNARREANKPKSEKNNRKSAPNMPIFNETGVVSSVFGSTWEATPTLAPIGPPPSSHKKIDKQYKGVTHAVANVNCQGSIFGSSPTNLCSKTGVEIWGNPESLPFTVDKQNDEGSNEVSRPPPPKSVEFPAEMNCVVNDGNAEKTVNVNGAMPDSQQQFDFMFDPTLPSIKQPTNVAPVKEGKIDEEPRKEETNGSLREEGEQMKKRLERVRAVWNHDKQEGSDDCLMIEDIVSAGVVQGVSLLPFPPATERPLVAKVRPQQMQPNDNPSANIATNIFAVNEATLKFNNYSPLNTTIPNGQAASPPMLTPGGMFSMTPMTFNAFAQPPPPPAPSQWNMASPFIPNEHNTNTVLLGGTSTPQYGQMRPFLNGNKPPQMTYAFPPNWGHPGDQPPLRRMMTPNLSQPPPPITGPRPPQMMGAPPQLLGAIGSQRGMMPRSLHSGFAQAPLLAPPRPPSSQT